MARNCRAESPAGPDVGHAPEVSRKCTNFFMLNSLRHSVNERRSRGSPKNWAGQTPGS